MQHRGELKIHWPPGTLMLRWRALLPLVRGGLAFPERPSEIDRPFAQLHNERPSMCTFSMASFIASVAESWM